MTVIAVTAATGLTVACNNGLTGDPGASPEATATDTSQPPSPTPTGAAAIYLPLLEQMVLQADDLPVKLTRVSAATTTNEDLAAESDNPERELARLEASGRLLSYEVTFVPELLPEKGIVAVASAARLYEAPEGAIDAFAEDILAIRNTDWPASYPNLTNVEAREVERPGMADQVIWQRITGLQEDGALFIQDFVVLRRDRVRTFLRVESFDEASAGPEAFLDEITALATKQIESIDTALLES